MAKEDGSKSIVYSSPIGPLKLVATDDGISAVKFLFGKHGEKVEEAACKQLSTTRNGEDMLKKADLHLNDCAKWLDAYFNGTLLQSSPPPPRPPLALPTTGTSFFHVVWNTLASTGIGETLSYKQLAKLSGSPRAARAVGQAVKKHSIPILVPCHRVVKSRSGAENYSGGDGTHTKEWLLKHEQKMLQQQEESSKS